MTAPPALAEKRLTIEFTDSIGGPPHRLDLELGRGHTYHAIATSEAVRDALIEQLVTLSPAIIVPDDGGLIGNLRVWENLVLPISYHGSPHYGALEASAADIFSEFGFAGERFASVCTLHPDRLGRFERRLVAFVRAMLCEPEIIVYDSLLSGLNREETAKALDFDRLFHRTRAARTSLFVTADLAVRPDFGAHRVFRF